MSRVSRAISTIALHEIKKYSFCELAVVTSNFDDNDDTDSHTVSVMLKDSGLTIPKVPVAHSVTGMAAVPRQNDIVVVALPRGDVSSAVVIAQVYSDVRRPPIFTRDEVALVWPPDSDDPEKECIDIRAMADGSSRKYTILLAGDKSAQLEVSDGAISLTTGGVEIGLNHSSDSDGVVKVAGGGTTIELAQDGDLKIEAAGALSLKASSIKIEGDTEVTINGQTVGIN